MRVKEALPLRLHFLSARSHGVCSSVQPRLARPHSPRTFSPNRKTFAIAEQCPTRAYEDKGHLRVASLSLGVGSSLNVSVNAVQTLIGRLSYVPL